MGSSGCLGYGLLYLSTCSPLYNALTYESFKISLNRLTGVDDDWAPVADFYMVMTHNSVMSQFRHHRARVEQSHSDIEIVTSQNDAS